jgi:sugar/nucleoside kinase (ribokinase family)
MPYETLARRLDAPGAPTVTTLPDGSVDRFCTIADGTDPIATRTAFGRELLGDRSAFQYRVEATEPGGQAVNAASQLHALGGDVTCYGHLDAPAFDSLPFETVSMGEPAEVSVFTFEERDVMLVRNADVTEWTLADLRRVGDLREVFGADAVCCGNWVSVPGMERAFHRLGEEELPRRPFVFDPGDVVGRSHEEIAALHDAIAALQGTFDVVYSANRAEIRATSEPLSGPFDDDLDRLAAIRRRTGIEAAVMHAEDEAAAATREGRSRVGNVSVERPERHTGGGDRFTGALGYALACGWEWGTALACGNACAAYYVDSGATGDPDDLVEFLEGRIEGIDG